MMNIKRGEIYYADLRPVVGSEQGGIRPVLIVQNDMGNLHSPTTIVAAITSRKKNSIPTHVNIHKSEENGLKVDSIVTLEQVRTIDKSRIGKKIGQLNKNDLDNVMEAMKIFPLGNIPALIKVTAVHSQKIGGIVDDRCTLAFEKFVQFQISLCVCRVAQQI